MSFVLGLKTAAATAITAFRANFVNRPALSLRYISRSAAFFNEANEGNGEKSVDEIYVDPTKDRRNPQTVETSIRYLTSEAYKETYGQNFVWKLYRRNHKGMYPPKKTRKTCVRGGIISTGNPCPICRDEFLIMDYRNIELVKQFISEHNGATISYRVTGICQKQHNRLLIAVRKARDYGTITFDVPFRKYDYSDWYNPEMEPEQKAVQ